MQPEISFHPFSLILSICLLTLFKFKVERSNLTFNLTIRNHVWSFCEILGLIKNSVITLCLRRGNKPIILFQIVIFYDLKIPDIDNKHKHYSHLNRELWSSQMGNFKILSNSPRQIVDFYHRWENYYSLIGGRFNPFRFS